MCVGENCAKQASSYVKAQLSTLYKNAVDCLKEHKPLETATGISRFSHALRKFDYYNKEGVLLLQTMFSEPRLDFICNHDVILRLHIESATFVTKDSTTERHSTSEVGVKFLVPFNTRKLDGAGVKYNNGQNPLQVVILELTKAKIFAKSNTGAAGQDTLAQYLKEYYLPFLAEAGNNVFLSIPSSDDDKYRLTIDHSMNTTIEERKHMMLEIRVGDMYGVSVDEINEQLSRGWLGAKVALANKTLDWKTYCLAEYSSTGTSGPFFRLCMHPPRLQPLCSQEAILYFHVDEVGFYEDSDLKNLKHKFKGWTIAIVVNITHESQGGNARCVVDSSSARSCASQSRGRTDAFANNDQSAEDWDHIMDFFSTTYLNVLKGVGLDVVYSSNSSTTWHPSHHEEETDDGGQGGDGTVVASLDSHTGAFFQQVSVISQSSINNSFGLLWAEMTHRDYALADWKYSEAYHRPLSLLRLLSARRAIIRVHLPVGSLKSPAEGDQVSASKVIPWPPYDWYIAFEVHVRRTVHSPELESSAAWFPRFKESLVYKDHGNRVDRTLEYILLDFEPNTAEFLFEHSEFKGLLNQADRNSINSSGKRVLDVVNHIKTYCFPALVSSGFNVLQAIPVRKPGTATSASNVSLTAFTISIYPEEEEEVTRENWCHASGSANLKPAIVVAGVTDSHPLPEHGWRHLQYTSTTTTRSYGTVCLPRAVFLDKCILDVLNMINARVALITLPAGFVDDRPHLVFSTREKNVWQNSQKCEWEEEYNEETGIMQFKWEHYDKRETGETKRFNYTALTTTRNSVRFPVATTRTPSRLDIKVSGETTLSLSTSQQESSKSESPVVRQWDTTITIYSGRDGLRVSLEDMPVQPVSTQALDSDNTLPNLGMTLQEYLPEVISLTGMFDKLKAFESPWTRNYVGMYAYCLANPVFNRNGDVIFELRPQSAVSPIQVDKFASGNGLASPSYSSIGSSKAETSVSSALVNTELNEPYRANRSKGQSSSGVQTVEETVEQTSDITGDTPEANGGVQD